MGKEERIMSEKNETNRMINDLMYAVEKKMKVKRSEV
jgi:hypothetical protein